MARGTVKWFNPRRGIVARAGFVSPDAGGANAFMHQSQVTSPPSGFEPSDMARSSIEGHLDSLRALDGRAV